MAESYLTTGTIATRRQPPRENPEPMIGDTKRFIPHALQMTHMEDTARNFGDLGEVYVTGVCCYVHRAGRWARYEYRSPTGSKAWECFKY